MKYIIHILVVLLLVVLVLVAVTMKERSSKPTEGQAQSADHLYITWDTMEFDKCVTAWLIVRFIDRDAQFRFVPKDTQITKGIPFDVPGAEWSRKHRKCTSQCVLETLDNADDAVEEIVSIASKVELNFWQLDRWPQAQRCFYEVKEIIDRTPDRAQCFERTRPYFDQLYRNFKRESAEDSKT